MGIPLAPNSGSVEPTCVDDGGGPYHNFKFHGQKRGVPLAPDALETTDKVEEVCGSMCKEKVGGMDMLEDEAWRNWVADELAWEGRGFDGVIWRVPRISTMCAMIALRGKWHWTRTPGGVSGIEIVE